MMSVLYPEAFLLVFLALSYWFWFTKSQSAGPGLNLRQRLKNRAALFHCLILMVGITALSSPVWLVEEEGSDLILVVDRSASMDEAANERVREIIKLAEDARGPDDRVGIVTFGRTATLEERPRVGEQFAEFEKEVDNQGSNLEAALGSALSAIPTNRRARVLVLSDGEYTGLDPGPLAWEAASRSIEMDYRHFELKKARDVAVSSVDVPRRVMRGEGFQFSAQLLSDSPGPVRYELRRNDEVISKAELQVRAGENMVVFRDRPWKVGVNQYELRISAPGDSLTENDYGSAVTVVEGQSPILLLVGNSDGGNLSRALKAAGHEVDVVEAASANLKLEDLASRPAVIVENVPALDFSRDELKTLSRYVSDIGGGLLVTGGRRSFGIGGYYKSPLEDTFPVTLELRKEARKLRMAIAFVLDRSGSMSLPVSGGTKMDLANRGCVAAADLMTPMDEAAAIAVDSAPHLVFDLQQLGDKLEFKKKVLAIESMGGGIYTYTGLAAGAKQLMKSTAGTRHIILFADAADAEEPGEYITLLKKLGNAGVTTSVIALGKESDPDAGFLKDVAARGGGEAYFTEDATELPQLFGMETMTISRAAFVDKPIEVRSHGALAAIGESTWSDFPSVGGYNLTYARPEAAVGLSSVDDYKAPIFASWQKGLGRCAVFTGEVDGHYTGDLASWEDYDSFFATVTNWLAGAEAPEELAGQVERFDDVVKVTLEVDPESADSILLDSPVLHVVPSDNERETMRIPLSWTGPFELTATYALENTAVHFHRIGAGKRTVKIPPSVLPYNPEFASRVGRPSGLDTLQLLAKRSGGKERAAIDQSLFDSKQVRQELESLALPLTILFLLLCLWEIAARRLGFGKFQFAKSGRREIAVEARSETEFDLSTLDVEAGDSKSKAQQAVQAKKRSSPLDVLKEAKRRSR